MKKVVLFSVLLTLVLSSCKKWQHKYPEDAERTNERPTQRLAGKIWTLNNVTLNGQEFTDIVYNQIGKYQLYFTSNIATPDPSFPFEYYYGNVESEVEGKFSLVYMISEDEERLSILRASAPPPLENVIALCYITEAASATFKKGCTILRLEKNYFKVKFSNTNQDSTITNTFVSD